MVQPCVDKVKVSYNEKKIKAFQLGNSYKILKLNVIDYILNSQGDLERTLEDKSVPDELK